jgi:hypothetical protein
VLGHKIVFICVATGKPRPNIVWFKDGVELYDHRYLHVRITNGRHVQTIYFLTACTACLFASLVLSMAAATKKEKKRRSLPLEGLL